MNNSLILPLPTDDLLNLKEKKWRIVLPHVYRLFIQQNNGIIPEQSTFNFRGKDYLVERFLAILQITGTLDEEAYDIGVVRSQLDSRIVFDGDYVGVELLPIATLFGGDFICFDYSKSKENPSVCIWYHEESYDLEPVIQTIAQDFSGFLGMLS